MDFRKHIHNQQQIKSLDTVNSDCNQFTVGLYWIRICISFLSIISIISFTWQEKSSVNLPYKNCIQSYLAYHQRQKNSLTLTHTVMNDRKRWNRLEIVNGFNIPSVCPFICGHDFSETTKLTDCDWRQIHTHLSSKDMPWVLNFKPKDPLWSETLGSIHQ